MGVSMKLWRVVVLATLAGAGLARAHDPGISTAEVRVLPDRVEIVTGFAPDDAKLFLPPELRSAEKWEEDTFEDVRPRLRQDAGRLWEVTIGGRTVAPREADVRLLPEDNVSYFLVYPRNGDDEAVRLRVLRLGELPPSHRKFAIAADAQGSTLARKLMRAEEAVLEVPAAGGTLAGGNGAGGGEKTGQPAEAEVPDGFRTFRDFLVLGVEHIWLGFDHLLFLFALLAVCRSFRSIAGIVTCFTVAHSITLALATFDLVRLPAAWVEPAIAVSIIYVGIENLLRRGEEPAGRWALTFAFGLIHGFGFAGVLRDLGLGRNAGEGVALPLLSFNLGVELGQIAIAAVVLPVVWRLRKREGFRRRGVPVFSGLVAAAGLFWLIERTLFR
jgi:hydrogenase/urease accessory protein HupE